MPDALAADPSLQQHSSIRTTPVNPSIEPSPSTWNELDAAWNARDPQRFTQVFANDATLKFVDRQLIRDGGDAILRNFELQFPKTPPAYSHHSKIHRFSALPGGSLLAEGRVEVMRMNADDPPAAEIYRAFDVAAVMTVTAEGWQIRALYVYLLPTHVSPSQGATKETHPPTPIN